MADVVVGRKGPDVAVEAVDVFLPASYASVVGAEGDGTPNLLGKVQQEDVGGLDRLAVGDDEDPLPGPLIENAA